MSRTGKRALITGITGQDGSYLGELLLAKGYEVHGLVRRIASEHSEHRLWRIRHLLSRLHLHAGSLESYGSLCKVAQEVLPEECYHLAGQSYVSYSFEDEFSTLRTNVEGTHALLAALRQFAPECRIYFAGSSEMFGRVQVSPQNEATPFRPQSSYGVSKVAGYHLCRYYQDAYGTHVARGILFNHESPRRGHEFVTRKITSHVARIKLGVAGELQLGNLEARRDWGHAREYVEAIWLMLQQPQPDDYVIATGESRSVREFVEAAFAHVGLDYRDWVEVDRKLFRPAEVDSLVGDASKARRVLGWQNKISFQELVAEMVEEDLDRVRLEMARSGAAR